MPSHDLVKIFVSRLNKLNIRYIITGAVASIIYGEPRLTNDLDLIIELHTDDVENFCDAFPLEEFYCPPPEIIRVEILRTQRGHFNLIHHETGYRADIYAAGQDELHIWALDNRKSIDVEGGNYWLAPVEYVVLRKLEYYREGDSEKHLRDIAGILTVSSDQINFKLLEAMVQEHMLLEEWEKAKKQGS